MVATICPFFTHRQPDSVGDLGKFVSLLCRAAQPRPDADRRADGPVCGFTPFPNRTTGGADEENDVANHGRFHHYPRLWFAMDVLQPAWRRRDVTLVAGDSLRQHRACWLGHYGVAS